MVSKRSKPKKRAVKSTKVKEEVKDNYGLDPATVGVKVLGTATGAAIGTIGTGAAIYHLRNKGGTNGSEHGAAMAGSGGSQGFFSDHLQELGISAVAAAVLAAGAYIYYKRRRRGTAVDGAEALEGGTAVDREAEVVNVGSQAIRNGKVVAISGYPHANAAYDNAVLRGWVKPPNSIAWASASRAR